MQQAEGKKPLSISLDHTKSLTIEKGKCIWFSWSNAFLKQLILSVCFWGNLAHAELSGDFRMFITCSFGGQHLCHLRFIYISVTPQFLLQVAAMQISAPLQTQTDENETR